MPDTKDIKPTGETLINQDGKSPEKTLNVDSGPKQKSDKESDLQTEDDEVKFTPEEEAALLEEANAIKTQANTLFASSSYESAIEKYTEALSTCPPSALYHRAVIQSNISACHLKLESWQDAIKAANESIDGLDKLEREDPRLNPEKAKDEKDAVDEGDEKGGSKDAEEEVEEEIISSGASKSAPAPTLQSDEQSLTEQLKADILRIRAKALLRRAKARATAGGWHNLAGAEEDYKKLSTMTNLTPADNRVVRTQLRDLPPRVKVAQEKEMGEMWGKLKDLGNGILKPFGLSTDNFQMVKDEKSGGYSMNFNQGGNS